jgi:DNA-directed RNA polymerase subunit beta'|uniref:DNA-directed RNA polymerase subunit beta' n=1 Tax=Vaucheria litorea TaxID=109269 RepID=B7T1S5_VAULI|nr:RNA polymerase beta' subunit [Vaucheria litorea]ACF70891.1 RNA polymerase beta' subunit [Vaucheria litorea]
MKAQISQDFDYININLASPERIIEWAEHVLPNGEVIGQVKSPETLNYKTLKPVMEGLFCERIFGPTKSWECYCGKYKLVHHQGLTCERCGVEITEARVRRHRMGYINLLTPVTHVWYLKGVPSYLSIILQKPLREIEQIVYFDHLLEQTINEFDKYFTNDLTFLKKKEKIGAEIILDLLKDINLNEQIKINRDIILQYPNSIIKLKQATRRIRILESFLITHSKPEWMILTVLPVIPPGLRPLVQLEGGQFVVSDLNELYRKLIYRNDRLANFLSSSSTPGIIVRSEKRLVQEAVDALIDNGKRGPKAVDINNRPLKSLADTIEGKQGRFRLNLLGKRVDYSGRSVIIVGPHLELNQCGLPYEMAVELFYPFIAHELINKGLTETIKHAKKIIQDQKNQTFLWKLIKEIIQGHPILLNRAPTLHRLGIQAFEPVLIQGRAIQLHPLVCPAFNADFDGDQMAVHIPLSLEAQTEARILMFAPNNFLSPATGDPIIQPTQDMLLGCYYLTVDNRPNLKGANHYFSNFDEVLCAYEQNQVDIHSSIWVRCLNNYNLIDKSQLIKTVYLNDESTLKIYNNLQIRESKEKECIVRYIRTTPGRIIFNKNLNSLLNL